MTDKEIVERLLENINNGYWDMAKMTGLCILAQFVIPEQYYSRAMVLLGEYRDKFGISYEDYCGYWWEKGKKEPRIEFLNNILKDMEGDQK
jgi:hypothetical protein